MPAHTTLQCRLSPELDAALNAYADSEGSTRTAVVVKALHALLHVPVAPVVNPADVAPAPAPLVLSPDEQHKRRLPATFTLRADTLDRLDTYAREHRLKRSRVVDNAISGYLNLVREKPKPVDPLAKPPGWKPKNPLEHL